MKRLDVAMLYAISCLVRCLTLANVQVQLSLVFFPVFLVFLSPFFYYLIANLLQKHFRSAVLEILERKSALDYYLLKYYKYAPIVLFRT